MAMLLLFLMLGMLLGFLFRKKKKLIILSEQLTAWSVYLMIFFLGASVGLNKMVLNTLHTLGAQALVLTAGSILGSVLISSLVYTFFFARVHEG